MAEKERKATCELFKVLDDEERNSRHAGCVALVDSKLYFWGGETSISYELPDVSDEDLDDDDDIKTDENECKTTIVVTLPQRDVVNGYPFDVFDLETLTWSLKYTSGKRGDSDVPNVGVGSTLTYHEPTNSLYLFGGWNKRDFTSDVYCISLSADKWEWEKIMLPRGSISPCPRYLTGVLLHNDRLYTFGGVCHNHGKDHIDEGSYYDKYVSDNVVYDIGWTNQYYEFDLWAREWYVPMSGDKRRPIPTGSLMFVKIDKCRALCFGGRTRMGRTNNAFIFDLDYRIFDGPLDLDVKPPARVFTSLCPLVDPQMVGTKLGPAVPPLGQKLLLLWGKNIESKIISDCWIFDCGETKWTQVELNEEGRYWQMACSYYPDPCRSSESQVVVYGGAKLAPGREVKYVEQRGLITLSFGVKTLKRLSLLAVVSALLQHCRDMIICPAEEVILHTLKIPDKLGHKIYQTLMAYTHIE